MSINSGLMRAILAMDSYNRGYNAGLDIKIRDVNGNVINTPSDGAGVRLGEAIVFRNQGGDEAIDIGFYAISYEYDGEVIISFRGTDQLLPGDGIGGDFPNGYSTGVGDPYSAQAIMAYEFYRTIDDLTPLDIAVTGHSLGGGLAGLIGTIHGLDGILFDNMAFEDAAEEAYEAATGLISIPGFKEQVYGPGDQDPPSPNHDDLHTEHMEGEFLHWNRDDQETPQRSIPVGDNVDLPGLDNGLLGGGLHSMSTLVLAKFAADKVENVAWKASAQYFWPVLYDDAFA